MMISQPGLFDLDVRYALLSDGGDPLERLSKVVSFEDFRPHLEDALERKDRSLGGPPSDGCGHDVQDSGIAKPVQPWR